MTADPADILRERDKTHGPWAKTAAIAQDLKFVAHVERADVSFNAARQEAVEMILTKIARIVSGDASHADHWNDIAGYAMLGRDGGVKEASTAEARLARVLDFANGCSATEDSLRVIVAIAGGGVKE